MGSRYNNNNKNGYIYLLHNDEFLFEHVPYVSPSMFVTMHPKIASFRTSARRTACPQDVTARCA